MIKSERYTTKYLNKEKFKILFDIDEEVKLLKNSISNFCHQNIFALISDDKFSSNYRCFKSDNLSAWEVQTIFQDIVKLYKEYFKAKARHLEFKTQKSFRVEYFKRNTTQHKIGDVKKFQLEYNKTGNLGKLIKYLCFSKDFTIANNEIQNLYDYYKNKGVEERIKKLVSSVRIRVQNNLRVIEFTTGSYRKPFGNNKDKNGNKVQENGFVFDSTNALYKHWFKYKTKNQTLYLPVEINNQYHNLSSIKDGQFFVKRNKNKFDFIGTKDEDNPDFKDFNTVVGIDLNVKHNFIYASDGTNYDYDRKYIKDFVKELKKLDKVGMKNLSESQTKHLDKLIKRNEWYFKKLISEILDQFVKNKITDIVMEDLSAFSKTFIKSEEFDVKYSRLVRLLRLSNIKTWLSSQAEKRGIKIHMTSPCYTSQQCSQCGHIDSENRKSQEEFECLVCGHKDNADLNASKNILNRYVSNVLRLDLHNEDEFGRLFPKRLNKETIKKILSQNVKTRFVL